MKLIIDIPDWYYKELQEFKHPDFVDKAIRDGVILPEVHGRLGDLDELEQRISNFVEYDAEIIDKFTVIRERFIVDGIRQTPTIIEADKED